MRKGFWHFNINVLLTSNENCSTGSHIVCPCVGTHVYCIIFSPIISVFSILRSNHWKLRFLSVQKASLLYEAEECYNVNSSGKEQWTNSGKCLLLYNTLGFFSSFQFFPFSAGKCWHYILWFFLLSASLFTIFWIWLVHIYQVFPLLVPRVRGFLKKTQVVI